MIDLGPAFLIQNEKSRLRSSLGKTI